MTPGWSVRVGPLGEIAAIAVLYGFSWGAPGHGDDDHDHPGEGVHKEHHEAHTLASEDPAAREARYRSELDDGKALRAGLAVEDDPSLRLHVASALVRLGDPAGRQGLVALVEGDLPFLRLEADERLRAVARQGAPAFDPLTGPDAEGVWADWARAAPHDRVLVGSLVPLPCGTEAVEAPGPRPWAGGRVHSAGPNATGPPLKGVERGP